MDVKLSISIPEQKRYVLVFDVETTGLIPRKNGNIALPISEYPHIIQFSFILYDIIDSRIIIMYDSYININEDILISPFISNLTGINKEDCSTKGRNIVDVIIAFSIAYKNCNVLVAHNMEFDSEIIMIEIQRNREEILKRSPECFTLFNLSYEKINNIERYCTMLKGVNFCNIIIESKTEGKPPRKKWPKLNELYEYLFDGEKVEGLHNSIIDVKTCISCYLKMRYGILSF